VATVDTTEPAAEDKPEEGAAQFGGGFGSAPPEESKPEEGAEGAAEDAAPVEDDAVEMTLDEYEVILAEKKAQLNKQAEATGVDLGQFKGMNAYKRKDEDEDTLGLELKNKKEAKQAKEKARKEIVTLETGFKVQSAEELGAGRGRGGRGRGRGRGDRPEGPPPRPEGAGPAPERRPFRAPVEERGGFGLRGRGRGRGTGPAPLIDDESAFPSLG